MAKSSPYGEHGHSRPSDFTSTSERARSHGLTHEADSARLTLRGPNIIPDSFPVEQARAATESLRELLHHAASLEPLGANLNTEGRLGRSLARSELIGAAKRHLGFWFDLMASLGAIRRPGSNPLVTDPKSVKELARRIGGNQDDARATALEQTREAQADIMTALQRILDSDDILMSEATEEQVVGAKPTNSNLESANDKIGPEQILAALAELGVSEQLCQQVAAALIAGDRARPLWSGRNGHEELAHLNAPRFLKHVYPDLFDSEGNLTNEDVVRFHDPDLVQVVQTYINDRQKAGKGPGDAKGITFGRRDNRGRPRKARNRSKGRAPSPS